MWSTDNFWMWRKKLKPENIDGLGPHELNVLASALWKPLIL